MNAPDSPELTIGVIGAGAMGQGIVQVALTGGMNVLVHDAVEVSAQKGIRTVSKRLDRLVEKGTLTASDAEHMKSRVTIASDLAQFSPCDAVIEAVYEDLELKRQIFQELESHVTADCILASNTSSLLIASIAKTCQNRVRIAGMHFFNPVPLMKLVEVVRGPDTGEAAIDFLTALGTRMGRTPVVVKDAPGFLVNLGGRAYTTEAMRIWHERVAAPAQVDAVMRDCCSFRMGPFELADLTGIDVNFPVSQIVYDGYGNDRRLGTSFPHCSLYEAGHFGRKTAHGIYRYDRSGAPVDAESADHQPQAEPAASVCLVEPGQQLHDFAGALGCDVLDQDDRKAPLLAFPVGEDCTTFSARTGCDFARLVAVDLSCDTTRRATIMTAPGANSATRDAVSALILQSGRQVTAIKDSPGFIAQRLRAMIANLGCEMAQIGIAEPDQIDLAMRLGLNYPMGPLELAEHIGLDILLAQLERMQAITGDDRYRPSGWLRRRALLGLSCHTPD